MIKKILKKVKLLLKLFKRPKKRRKDNYPMW